MLKDFFSLLIVISSTYVIWILLKSLTFGDPLVLPKVHPPVWTKTGNLNRMFKKIDELLYNRESYDLDVLQINLMSQDIASLIIRANPTVLRKFLPKPVSMDIILVSYYKVTATYAKIYTPEHERIYNPEHKKIVGGFFSKKISDDIFIKERPRVQEELKGFYLSKQNMKGIL